MQSTKPSKIVTRNPGSKHKHFLVGITKTWPSLFLDVNSKETMRVIMKCDTVLPRKAY